MIVSGMVFVAISVMAVIFMLCVGALFAVAYAQNVKFLQNEFTHFPFIFDSSNICEYCLQKEQDTQIDSLEAIAQAEREHAATLVAARVWISYDVWV